jgi:hypothetical protein
MPHRSRVRRARAARKRHQLSLCLYLLASIRILRQAIVRISSKSALSSPSPRADTDLTCTDRTSAAGYRQQDTFLAKS